MTEVETERRNRIRLSIAAYAYEYGLELTMNDGEFDALAKKIQPDMPTWESRHDMNTRLRYGMLDDFFKTEFSPDTGQWIHKHPELPLIQDMYSFLHGDMIAWYRMRTK